MALTMDNNEARSTFEMRPKHADSLDEFECPIFQGFFVDSSTQSAHHPSCWAHFHEHEAPHQLFDSCFGRHQSSCLQVAPHCQSMPWSALQPNISLKSRSLVDVAHSLKWSRRQTLLAWQRKSCAVTSASLCHLLGSKLAVAIIKKLLGSCLLHNCVSCECVCDVLLQRATVRLMPTQRWRCCASMSRREQSKTVGQICKQCVWKASGTFFAGVAPGCG